MDVLTNTSEVAKRFPGCINVDISATWVPVLADARSDDLGFGSATRVTQGMALWFAMMTHILGCEAYVRLRSIPVYDAHPLLSCEAPTRLTITGETTFLNRVTTMPMLISDLTQWLSDLPECCRNNHVFH